MGCRCGSNATLADLDEEPGGSAFFALIAFRHAVSFEQEMEWQRRWPNSDKNLKYGAKPQLTSSGG
jgi:hypothetical protein